ncbi:MAG: glycosyltransferase family 2 protein [Patescibacteria group bacterium]
MKFSIVTPVYNGQRFLSETIESVLSQAGDFEIEYIVQDGGSTDGTIALLEEWQRKVDEGLVPARCKKVTMQWASEKDAGMYDAVNKGFARAGGDVYAYINADDIYAAGAFQKIAAVFSARPDILWLKGITSFIDERSAITERGRCYLYNQEWIARGFYGRNAYFIHQDSVFWRKELWNKAGGIDPALKLAGDYSLWLQFAKVTPLWSLDAEVSSFRSSVGQLSTNMKQYREEQATLSRESGPLNKKVKMFFWLRSKLSSPLFTPIFSFTYRTLFPKRNLYYIALDEQGKPVERKASSYVI